MPRTRPVRGGRSSWRSRWPPRSAPVSPSGNHPDRSSSTSAAARPRSRSSRSAGSSCRGRSGHVRRAWYGQDARGSAALRAFVRVRDVRRRRGAVAPFMIATTRRTQNALRPFFAFFGVAVFLLLARETPPIIAAQSIAARALIPLERAVSDAGAGVSGFFGSIAELEQLRADHTALRSQVESLTLENVRLHEQVTAAQQIANLGGIAASLPYKTIGAQVISRDPAGFVKTLTIDAGTDQGVAIGDVIVAEQGLVGRVTA